MIFSVPWADAGFGLDHADLKRWWPRFQNEVAMPVFWAMPDDRTTWPEGPVPERVALIRRASGPGLSDDPSMVYGGGTSGYGALGLAYLKRAKDIVLFGYDYGRAGDDWHADETPYERGHVYHESRWQGWARFLSVLAPILASKGMNVTNASPQSAVTGFPRVTVEGGIHLAIQGSRQ